MDAGSIVAIVAGVAGVIFGIVTLFRNKKKDDEDGGKQAGIVLTELGYIKSSVDDIKRKQDTQDASILGLLRELTEVKASTQSAHKRIDGLENRLNSER